MWSAAFSPIMMAATSTARVAGPRMSASARRHRQADARFATQAGRRSTDRGISGADIGSPVTVLIPRQGLSDGCKRGSSARCGHQAPAATASERNLVIRIGAGTGRTGGLSIGRPRAVALAVEKGQHPVVRREMDLGAVAVRARLVLPLAGGQLAFEVDFRTFPQVALSDYCRGPR